MEQELYHNRPPGESAISLYSNSSPFEMPFTVRLQVLRIHSLLENGLNPASMSAIVYGRVRRTPPLEETRNLQRSLHIPFRPASLRGFRSRPLGGSLYGNDGGECLRGNDESDHSICNRTRSEGPMSSERADARIHGYGPFRAPYKHPPPTASSRQICSQWP
jgi:hypothetical protein